jgi:hypothetical protein
MSNALKAGDRVRVKARTRIPKYPAGEKGTVAKGPHQLGDGRRYYFVEMDQDQPRLPVVFTESEIEADVLRRNTRRRTWRSTHES